MMPRKLVESAAQTAGPYVHIGCLPKTAGLLGYASLGSQLVQTAATGERVTVEGYVIDGNGAPLLDAMVEVWQADAAGVLNSPLDDRAADPGFAGFGRCGSDATTGLWRFETIVPGRLPWADGRLQAPHLSLWIAARGINLGLHTRMYFPGNAANTQDPVLTQAVPEARRRSLIAVQSQNGYRFDIHLQGERETVFFDV